jgi:hypothetical protein
MEDNFEQLKQLKEMLESGAISKTEYDNMKAELLRESMANDGVKSAQKPSGFSLFLSRNKWKLLGFIAVIGAALFAWYYFSADPVEEGKKMAESYCDCQKKKNEAYISRLSEFVEGFDGEGYKFAKDVQKELDKLNNEYDLSTITPEVSTCFKAFDLKNTAAETEWKSTTKKGKSFWAAFQTAIIQNTDLVTQEEEIAMLRDRIQSKLATMIFDNPEDYENRKAEISSMLNGYFANLESDYFDAYSYFAYSVEQYLTSKNITPTEINIIQKKESDYESKETRLIDETLELTGVEDERQIWKFSTEFKAYRTSMEKYQVCNIWYEIMLNKSGKIVSYKELRTENKKMLSAEEYNEMFNGGSGYGEDSGW